MSGGCCVGCRPMLGPYAAAQKGPVQRSRLASAPTPGAESAFKIPILHRLRLRDSKLSRFVSPENRNLKNDLP
jgi:hypothetical protein